MTHFDLNTPPPIHYNPFEPLKRRIGAARVCVGFTQHSKGEGVITQTSAQDLPKRISTIHADTRAGFTQNSASIFG